MPPEARAVATANRARRVRIVWAGVGGVVYAASRVGAAFTVAGNWDEFALLDRAARSFETGVLTAGGRPGLATLVLMPFAAGCRDEISTLHAARLLWVGITLAFLAGLWVLLWQACARSRRRAADAWLGVGLLALVPAFLEWSIQVRSDQLALVFGVWGGVALLASRRRPMLAAVAGLSFAVGYLATQKLAYVGALAGTLALGDLWSQHDFRARREAIRAAACAACFGAVLAGFDLATTARLEVPQGQHALASLSPGVVAKQLSEFEYYRNTIGFSQYLDILPTLVPHAVLLAALVAATGAGLRSRKAAPEELWIAWAVLAAGLGIAAFHASAFAYFFMTLGLFPAAALAIAGDAVRRTLFAGRQRVALLAVIGLWLVLWTQGALRMAELSIDTQAVQRESLAFIHGNFDATDAGFHPEHGPFCRAEPAPIRRYFSQVLYRHFAGENRAINTRNFLSDFRSRQVKFVLQSFRLNQFPVEIRRFLAENYQPYRASVFVAGRHLAGGAGTTTEIELLVPGRYRWIPFAGPRTVRIGTWTLGPGETAELGAGSHTVEFVEDVPGGMLVLAVADPPGKAPLAFYKSY